MSRTDIIIMCVCSIIIGFEMDRFWLYHHGELKKDVNEVKNVTCMINGVAVFERKDMIEIKLHSDGTPYMCIDTDGEVLVK